MYTPEARITMVAGTRDLPAGIKVNGMAMAQNVEASKFVREGNINRMILKMVKSTPFLANGEWI